MSSIIEISESVRHYYGQVLQSSNDLKTSACCSIDAIPAHLKMLLAKLHPEVVERFTDADHRYRLRCQAVQYWI